MRVRITLALLPLLLLAGRVDAAPFTDGDFAPADWEIVVFSFKSSGGAFPGGAVTAAQEPDGYPGTRRRIDNTIIAAPSASEYSSTWGAHLRAGAVWDPMAQGTIGTLDYEEDALLFAPAGDGQLTGLAIRQGGVVYVADVDVTPDTAWTHKSRTGIGATDLYAMTDAGPVSGQHPDFSAATGAPIQFGFLRANSNGNGNGGYTLSGAIDNWFVRVNSICLTDQTATTATRARPIPARAASASACARRSPAATPTRARSTAAPPAAAHTHRFLATTGTAAPTISAQTLCARTRRRPATIPIPALSTRARPAPARPRPPLPSTWSRRASPR